MNLHVAEDDAEFPILLLQVSNAGIVGVGPPHPAGVRLLKMFIRDPGGGGAHL